MEPRDMVDILILIIIGIGLLWAGFRLRADLTRPLSDENNETDNQ